MASIPETYHDVFEKRSFAHFATLMSSGHPRVTPVWVDYELDPERVLVNTARGRQKEHDVARDPKVGLSVLDPDGAYRYVSVRGEVTEEGAPEHIDALARRYMGVKEYPLTARNRAPGLSSESDRTTS